MSAAAGGVSDFHQLDKEAAEYVEQHSLEEYLSSAVDQAIQQRSDRPLEVIVEHLQKILAESGGGAAGKPPLKSVPSRGMDRSGQAGRSRDGPMHLDIHVKARSQENPQYPVRLPVPDESVRWTKEWPEYAPDGWTHPVVLENSRDAPTGHKWADPPDTSTMREELNARTTYTMGGGMPCTFAESLEFDAIGRPLNPVGRTGMSDRGLLGKWGSNHAADPIVTRFHPETGQLQVVAIQRKDTLQWAIPGGMVDPGEAVSVTVKREFQEEAGAISDPTERAEFESACEQLFQNGRQVYRGYVDDPRATDHAWMETTAFHFHCSNEIGKRLPLKAGDDAGQVMWLDVSLDNPTYKNLYGSHRAMIDEAVWSAWNSGAFAATIVNAAPKS